MQIGPDRVSIWRINGQFILAILIFGLGYLYWSWSSKEWWFFAVLAAMCGLAGSFVAIKALVQIARHIVQDAKLRRYGRQGEAPKADQLGQRSDMHNLDMLD